MGSMSGPLKHIDNLTWFLLKIRSAVVLLQKRYIVSLNTTGNLIGPLLSVDNQAGVILRT